VTYLQVLTDAWADARAPRAAGAPTVASLFAGAGGSSLGFAMAGYREVLAVEWDDHAAACLARNFPGVRVHHGDVADVDPAMLGMPAGELDVLDGSPPCQGFSTAGRRSIDDPRNQLFRQYVRLLRAWRPRALVMENVAGMASGKMRGLFGEVCDELRSCGYRLTVARLNAAAYGVPQARERVIFVGVRGDLDAAPSHPRPTSGPVSVRRALAGLTDPGLVVRPTGNAANLARALRPGKDGKSVLVAGGRKGAHYNLYRVAWDVPCRTIFKAFMPGLCGHLHPDKQRYLGSRELCVLQSFPLEYDWADSTYAQIHARLGNSVPPLLMRAVARHLRGVLGR